LHALCLVSHKVRKEARAFFFSSNKFYFTIKGMGFVKEFFLFLRWAGPDGRACLKYLSFNHSGGLYRPGRWATHDGMLCFLEDCVNLKKLKLTMQLEFFLKSTHDLDDLRADAYPAMKSILHDDGILPTIDSAPLVSLVQKLAEVGQLQELTLECVYELRRRRREGADDNMRAGWEDDVKSLLMSHLSTVQGHVEVFVEVLAKVTWRDVNQHWKHG
jgi:hypothetical protein